MTILDTTVMVALLNGKPDTIDMINKLQEKNSQFAITIITAYELVKGAYLSAHRKENLSNVKEAISNLQILDLSLEACIEAAEIYSELKTAGRLIGEFDILIAAIAKTNGETILTSDQHFKPIKGLQLIEC